MPAFFDTAVGGAYHIVAALAVLLAPLPWGLATAAAIAAVTIAVRLVLLPLTYHAMRGQASQARLAPQIQSLRRRHGGHPDRLQRELAALYQREGTGMFAGCLPALLQLPFLSVVYRLFRSATISGRPNGLLGHDLLGAPLAGHWLSGPGPFSVQGAVFLGLFALLAVAAWLSARSGRRSAALLSAVAADQAAQPGQHRHGQAQPDRAMWVLTRAAPYATLAVAAALPLAAALYLLTSTAWAAVERPILARRISRHRGATTAS